MPKRRGNKSNSTQSKIFGDLQNLPTPPKTNFIMRTVGVLWNSFRRATKWAVANPKEALLGVLLISAAGAVLKFILQNNSNNTVEVVNAVGESIQPMSDATCPVAIFYEAHHDKAPAEMMLNLFPNFVKGGYKTFLFEEPTDTSLDQNIEGWTSGITRMVAKLNSGQYSTSSVEYSYLESNVDSVKTSLKLLKKIKKRCLNYEAMDLDTSTRNLVEGRFDSATAKTIRDDHMAKRIQESCKKHGGGQVALVGTMHNGIEQRLQKAGYTQVSSTFIINHAPFIDPTNSPGRHDNNVQLRNKNPEYIKKYGYENTNIINVYDNPNIDVKEEVLAGLDRRTPIPR